MPRYIDAEGLNLYDDLFMSKDTINKSGVYVRYRAVENLIKNAPTADVQEVIRCKDCKYLSKPIILDTGYTYFRCERWISAFADTNGYCAWGRKMEGKDEEDD